MESSCADSLNEVVLETQAGHLVNRDRNADVLSECVYMSTSNLVMIELCRWFKQPGYTTWSTPTETRTPDLKIKIKIQESTKWFSYSDEWKLINEWNSRKTNYVKHSSMVCRNLVLYSRTAGSFKNSVPPIWLMWLELSVRWFWHKDTSHASPRA